MGGDGLKRQSRFVRSKVVRVVAVTCMEVQCIFYDFNIGRTMRTCY